MGTPLCLIVDSEAAIRGYVKTILERHQFRTLEAENAVEAFKLVQKLRGGVDLILSEITMAGDMNGLDLAYAIKYSFPAIRVVLTSAYADIDARKHSSAGFVFLEKPFRLESLLTAIDSARAAGQKPQVASAGSGT
jgi:DNA-binding NtrC family response regulator